ncbi:MAG: TonB-dependent receptor [Smithella sp.]|nr:TonB-dependent receptor [Smithella sp.]
MKKRLLLTLCCFFVIHAGVAIESFAVDEQREGGSSQTTSDNRNPAAKPVKEFEVYHLGEVVVASEKPGVREVAIVNEISADDIKATNSKTLAEALFRAPGVRVTAGAKNEANVSIHGFAQKQLLVLIDGVPYYETKYGRLDLNQIPTENIAKIEITKGAASVLYGANALGGVINVITKKPSEKLYAGVSFEASENDTYRASATTGMKAGIFNYWLNYTWAKSGGYDLSDDYQPKMTTIQKQPGGKSYEVIQGKGERLNSGYESHNIWAKFGIEPKEGSAYYVNIHYLDRDKAWSPSTDTIRYFNSRPYFTNFAKIPDYIDWGIDLDARQKIHDKVTLKAKLFYHNHKDSLDSYTDQSYAIQLAHSSYKDYIAGGSFFADFQPVDWNILRFAVHYKKDNHKERADAYLPFEESASYTGSVGLENEFNLVKNLSVVAGVSYDWFEVDKSQKTNTDGAGNFINFTPLSTNRNEAVNPMLGLVYNFSNQAKVFASVAHKSRFPMLEELYSSKGGNVNLETEKSWNYTLGASSLLTRYAKAGLSAFYYDVSDMISKDGMGWIGTNYNVGKVQLYGFEFNAEIYPIDGLTLRLDYTYEEGRNRSEGRVTDDVTYIPRHKLDAGMQYVIPMLKTRLDFNMIHVSSTYSQLPTPSSPSNPVLKASDYTLFDAKITQPIWKYFEVYVACRNIFDKNYEPEVGYPAPGRSFWTGILARY